jgi:metallo-beta-lactamase class B
MYSYLKTATVAALLLLTFGAPVRAQGDDAQVAAHVNAAKTAAGKDFEGVFSRVCTEARAPAAPTSAAPPARPSGPPERSTWYAEPVKVFDNLYFVGQSEYSAWAVTTSDGIIIVDTIFDYSVKAEVADGLTKLGLDPQQIKYAIVSHGHGDHSGGAKYLQDTFGARIVLSADDWDLLERSNGTKPKRDIVATDGMKLTLGDTTLTLYVTPGHTLGTLSTVIPVKDNGRSHVAVEWGGTAFNWMNNNGRGYITAERPATFWFENYIKSSARFRDIAKRSGADVLIANHTIFDGSKTKLPAMATRKPGDPHPYVIGADGVQRYMTVVNECAQAGLARVASRAP